MTDLESVGFVLAAGLGTRLKPYTDRHPKPLLPFFGVPLLERAIRRLAAAGIVRIVVNAHHFADQVDEFVAGLAARMCAERRGVDLCVSREEALLGTGGGIARASRYFEGRRVVVTNGDIWFRFDLEELVRFHVRQGAIATALLHTGEGTTAPLTTAVDGEGRIVSIASAAAGSKQAAGRGRFPGVFSGVYVLEPAFYDRLPERPCSVIDEGFLPAIRAGEPVCGLLARFPWHDLGTWEDVVAARRAALADASGDYGELTSGR